MTLDPLGDRAFIVRGFDGPAHALAEALHQSPPEGLVDSVASYETVGLFFRDPEAATAFQASFAPPEVGALPPAGRLIRIPTCYEKGPDLEDAAAKLGLTSEALIAAHGSVDYSCFAIGFCPGFAYLGYLSEAIAGLPRLPQPRKAVEPGSVGITGRQTGFYPLVRPGGWWLIGRTPVTLVDVEDRYFPIQAGDRIRFEAISPADYDALLGSRL